MVIMADPSPEQQLVFPPENDPLLEVRIRNRTKEPHLQHANIVLTALTDVIQSQGITASSSKAKIATAYFGALMVSLDATSAHSADTLAGITHLLALVFPQLPVSVLRAKAGDIAPILLQLLDAHAETTAVAKSTLSCIAALLAAVELSSAALLQSPYLLHLFQALLVYSLDPRPKLRQLSQVRTSAVLHAFHSAHPVLPRALMDAVQSFSEREVHGATGKECQEVLYLCGLLQMTGDTLTLSTRAFLLELLLTVPLKASSVLFVQVMRTVSALSGDEAVEAAEPKYAVMLDRLLTALVDFAPHLADIDANSAFSAAVVRLLSCLVRAQPGQCGRQLLAWFDVYSGVLLSPKPSVVRIASQTLCRVLQVAVQPEWIQTAVGDSSGDVQALVKAAEVRPSHTQRLQVRAAVLRVCDESFLTNDLYESDGCSPHLPLIPSLHLADTAPPSPSSVASRRSVHR